MNRQTTYFLQKVLTGLASSVIYAAFDYYRYNDNGNNYSKRSYKNNNNFIKKPKNYEKRTNKMSYVETGYNRKNSYK